jgi:hypothetical protein
MKLDFPALDAVDQDIDSDYDLSSDSDDDAEQDEISQVDKTVRVRTSRASLDMMTNRRSNAEHKYRYVIVKLIVKAYLRTGLHCCLVTVNVGQTVRLFNTTKGSAWDFIGKIAAFLDMESHNEVGFDVCDVITDLSADKAQFAFHKLKILAQEFRVDDGRTQRGYMPDLVISLDPHLLVS